MSDLSKYTEGLSPEKRALFEALLAEKRGRSGRSGPQQIVRRAEGELLVLSFAQQRLWFFDQMEPGSGAYNIPLAVRLSGSIDVVALERTFNEIVRRHETLRTTFVLGESQPMQVIAPELTLALPVRDMRDASEDEIQRLATELNQQPFDLERGPLLRAVLLQRGPTEHVLLLNLHHIVSDGWSLGVLVQEMSRLYEAFARGGASDGAAVLPELPIQYADFALWQRRQLEGAALQSKLDYWKQQLGGRLPVLELPTDRPRPAVQGFRGARQWVAIPRPLTESLKALSQAEGVTLFVTVLAAFKMLLHRYSGQTDIIVGSPIANRTRSELEGLIGFFVNSLALRTDLSGNPTFRELLQRVRDVSLDADAHQDVPFERLVEVLAPERDLSHNPLFQVMLVLQNAPLPLHGLSNLTMTPLDVESGTAKLDLTLELYDRPDGLGGWLEYNVDLFDASTIARMDTHLQVLLAGIVADPNRRLSDLPLLTHQERQQQVHTWNLPIAPIADRFVTELFSEQAARTPAAPAVVFVDAHGVTQQLSYAQLDQRAEQLASYLRQLTRSQPSAELLAGLYFLRSPELIVAILGVLKAGGAYVPLDPDYPDERLRFMLANAGVAVVLTQQQLQHEITELLATPADSQPLTPAIVSLDADWPTIAAAAKEPRPPLRPEQLAYVIYTSGSTGQAKGVLVPHRGLSNLARAQISAFDVRPGSRVLQFAALSFDAAVSELLMTLLAGATLYLAPRETLLPGPELLDLLRTHAIDVVTIPPSVLAALPAAALPALRTLAVAGENCPPELVARWGGDARRFLNAYGPTEASVCATIAECRDSSRRLPIGRPIANTQVYVLDERMEPVPVGVAGELYIGGLGLARGYCKRPDLTALSFVPHPFSAEPGARLYKTGDFGRFLEDSTLVFLGRRDQQVKLRGFRIELGEVEAVLSAYPGVAMAVAQMRELGSASAGRTDQRLVAYVQPQPGAVLTPDELRSFVKAQLPEYMVPSIVVLLDALPMLPNGKIDRFALPAPEATSSTTYVMPQNQQERIIAAIWQEVLQIEKVGIHDNFFDLGGHSLLLVQVHAKLRAAVSADISMVDLFKYPTISALVEYLSQPQPVQTAQQQGVERGRARSAARAEQHAGIAIVGMALRFPGATTPEQFWHNLCSGVESISFYRDEEVLAAGIDPAQLTNPNYVKAEAAVADVDLFDAAFFGYTPREAERLDPQHRFFLEAAWEALERAGYAAESYPGRIGVYGGSNMSSYMLHNMSGDYDILDVMSNYHLRSLLMIGNAKDFMCQRVSYHLKLDGPSVNVQTACSTSLVAVHTACQALLHAECDMALAGGVQIRVPQNMGYIYLEGGVPSPDGHCRPFDINSKGTVHANGAGLVVLKRLDDALRDGDTIHAVIKGSAINNDGAQKVGFAAPSVNGQASVISEALAVAGVDAETISYVEAHGTATELGDPIEVAALAQAFDTSRQQYCPIGSVKSNLGHLDQASGVAGLIKTVLALKHGQIPPTLHFTAPNPRIDFANSPFYVNASLTDWPMSETPRRAGVSSFGIGGTNSHAVLEEAPVVEPSAPARPWHTLVLSAKTASALDSVTDNLLAYLRQHPEANLADVAYTLQCGRSVFSYRRIIVGRDVQDAVEALTARDPRRVFSISEEATNRQVVFMFPGQGAQYINMAAGLYADEPVFRAEIDRCATLLQPLLGLDLRSVLYPEPQQASAAEAQLQQTALTQPALFAVEYALAQLWINWGVRPIAMIGHSIGEYVAACLAGVFSLEDALRLVATRGRLMQSVPAGAMLSVPLPEQELLPLLDPALSLAAVNGPALSVVAGPAEAIQRLADQLHAQGLETRPLHTSHAFHSVMMEPILEQFRAELRQITLHPPQLPYISNVTGGWVSAEQTMAPDYWSNHLRATVRFADGLTTLFAGDAGAGRVMIEIGPGQTLSSLVQQHSDRAPEQVVVAALRRPHEPGDDRATLLAALGKCWLAGVKISWANLYAEQRRQRLELPTYPFERQRYWIEPPHRGRKPVAAQPALDRKPDSADWFYLPAWQPSVAPAIALADLPAAHWLIFDDECGIGARLAERLTQLGQSFTQARAGTSFAKVAPQCYMIDPDQPADYDRLLAELGQPEQPLHICHLWSVGGDQTAAPAIDRLVAAETRGLYSLICLTQALARQAGPAHIRLGIVSSGAHSVHGQEPLAPEKAPLLAASGIISQEHPQIACRSIDITLAASGSATKLVDRLIAEVVDQSPDPIVAYRAGQRWTYDNAAIRLPASAGTPAALRQGGTYLLIGGISPINVALADNLARTIQARIALVGTGFFPSPATWDHWLSTHGDSDPVSLHIRTLQEIQRQGGQVLVIDSGARDMANMQHIVAQVQDHFGALHGVIYTAALAAERRGRIETIDRPDNGSLISIARDAYSLAGTLRDQPLDFCLVVTSLAATLSTEGQLLEAAANQFLSALTQQQSQADGTRWICLSLEAEKILLAAPATGEQVNPLALTQTEAMDILHRALVTEDVPQMIVSPVDLAARISQQQIGGSEPGVGPATSEEPVTSFSRSAGMPEFVAPQSGIEELLIQLWQEALGIDQIGVFDNFYELGGHSLLATQIIIRIREVFEVTLPLRTFLELGTVAGVAEMIAEQQVKRVDTDELARLLEQLEQLSEDEARQDDFPGFGSSPEPRDADPGPGGGGTAVSTTLALAAVHAPAALPDPAPVSPAAEQPQQFTRLLAPTQIGTLQLKNRIVLPAMECGFGSETGFVTQQMLDYYEERARGGVGLIITEATCVDAPVGRLAPRQNLVADDSFIPGLRRLAEVVQRHGARIALQIFHAGRKTTSLITGAQPVAPSPVANHWGDQPRELTVAEIGAIVARFADAAARAQAAGFDGVEIHAAHGYLISQFLSPLYNQRRDEYGGSIQNRARVLVETLRAIRARVGPTFPVWCRLSAMEYEVNGAITPAAGGITLEETQIVARLAEAAGADAIHVSASHIGQVRMHPMAWPEGVLAPLAAGIKQVVAVPVIAVGRISPELGEQMLALGEADLIAMGRALIADPQIPRKLAEGRRSDITPCIYCWMCLETVGRNEGAGCPVNASFGKERVYTLRPAAQRKRVIVVGGGISGMEAARVAALRGHQVILFEQQQQQLGGQVLISSQPPVYQASVETFRVYLAAQLAQLDVELRLGQRFTPELSDRLRPDAVVVATGARPERPSIPGIEREQVLLAEAVLAGAPTGQHVVVIGGETIGCSTALHLAAQGKQVTIMRRGPQLATKLGPSMRAALLADLERHGVSVLTGIDYQAISDAGVTISSRQQEPRTIAADSVVIAASTRPDNALVAALASRVPQVLAVGDSDAPGGLAKAVDDGYRVGLSL